MRYYEGVNGRLIPSEYINDSAAGKIFLRVLRNEYGYVKNEIIETYPRYFVTKKCCGDFIYVTPAAYKLKEI